MLSAWGLARIHWVMRESGVAYVSSTFHISHARTEEIHEQYSSCYRFPGPVSNPEYFACEIAVETKTHIVCRQEFWRFNSDREFLILSLVKIYIRPGKHEETQTLNFLHDFKRLSCGLSCSTACQDSYLILEMIDFKWISIDVDNWH
jgi:hypothetical protein